MSSTALDQSQLAAVAAAIDTSGHGGTPRKRRRRAPASGAADDCFACRKRQMRCDRRRPYCTQCLDQGKDCSGYKTQLTWGVGVASRGKLRGQTLPIVKKSKSPPVISSQRARRSFSSTTDSAGLSPDLGATAAEGSIVPLPNTTALTPTITSYDPVPIESPSSVGVSVMHSPEIYRTPAPAYRWVGAPSRQSQTLYNQRQSLPAMPHPHTPPMNSFQTYGLSGPGATSGSFNESNLGSPINFSRSPEEASFLFPPAHLYAARASHARIPLRASYVPGDQRISSAYYPEPYLPSGNASLSSSLSSVSSSNFGSMDGSFDVGDSHNHGHGHGHSLGHGLGRDRGHKPASSPLDSYNLSDVLFDDDMPRVMLPGMDATDLGFGYANPLSLSLSLSQSVRPRFLRKLTTYIESQQVQNHSSRCVTCYEPSSSLWHLMRSILLGVLIRRLSGKKDG